MNAEALIGTVLGTCTLQKLVGQGGMGAVFLAQQSRPKRQVAVKVLLPMRPLSPNQLAAFLERFRRETDAAASMEHPNIMPVHEYGEREGLAYLVMPYVSGGTLRDELERCGPLLLETVASYLEQIAAAIDFAHEHGVIHRDIKPANIMVTPEGRLLLGDFGLVKIVADGQAPQVRITGVGAPVGTPDYMSPEQVIGEEVDVRADLYSLGVVLYQMVTGTTPFRGETPMQIAAQHLQVPPPSAQMMRPDLPIKAEQVLQRALAKRPADRYMSAQDLSDAFRSALLQSGIELKASYYTTNGILSGSTSGRFAVPKGQFDPMRQTASSIPKVSKPVTTLHNTGRQSAVRKDAPTLPSPPLNFDPLRLSGGHHTGKSPVVNADCSVRSDVSQRDAGSGLLSRTGKFPMVGTATVPAVRPHASPVQGGETLRPSTGKYAASAKDLPMSRMAGVVAAGFTRQSLGPERSPAGTPPSTVGRMLGKGVQVAQELTGAIRSSSPVQGADIPVVERSGHFSTRWHPVGVVQTYGASPQATADPVARRGQAPSLLEPTRQLTLTPRMKMVLLVAAVVLIAVGIAGFLLFIHHTPSHGAAAAVTIQHIQGTKQEGFHGRTSINW
jgi:serine/threonine protein kinase